MTTAESASDYCLAGKRCRDYDHARDRPSFVWNTPLCAECLRVGERAATQLVYDYRDLEQHIPPSLGQRLDGQPGHSMEAPIPIRVDVEALQRAIWWVSTTWAEILSDRQDLIGLPKRVRDGWAVQWACRILAPRVEALAGVEAQEVADYPLAGDGATRLGTVEISQVTGAQAVLDLMWLHDRARGMLGLTKLVRKLPGYCPRCQHYDLRQDNGADDVYCGVCGHVETRDDYEAASNVFLGRQRE